MSIFYPTLALRRVSEITLETIESLGVSALILDADNTLATHNNPEPAPDILGWLDNMKQAGIKLFIVSNNYNRRIRPFAESLGLEYTAMSCKPLWIGFERARLGLGLPPRNIAVVGDQIFTDVLGGNLYGSPTILVEPIEPERGVLFRFKRRVETYILRCYRKKRGSHI